MIIPPNTAEVMENPMKILAWRNRHEPIQLKFVSVSAYVSDSGSINIIVYGGHTVFDNRRRITYLLQRKIISALKFFYCLKQMLEAYYST